MLLALLRTRVGEMCLQQWQQPQWHETLWDDLEDLKNCGFLDMDTAVLQLKVVDERTSLEISWSGVTALTFNTNRFKKQGNLFSKFRDQAQFSKFKFHLDASIKHKLFVSDDNSTSQHTTAARSGGVVTVCRDGAYVHDPQSLSSVHVDSSPLYVQNVYAPVDQQERRNFFAQVSGAATFEDNASRIVMGDFNLPMNATVDATTSTTHANQARSLCLEWLATLGVVDAWRIEHGSARVFTGPQPRRNRLDYLFLSHSTYFTPTHAGDHLAHSVAFRQGVLAHGRGYWKFRTYLLEYPLIVQAIKQEAADILTQLRVSTNPGRDWEKWKKHIKRLLQQLQESLRTSNAALADAARQILDTAATRYKHQRDSNSKQVFEQSLREHHDCLTRTRKYSQDKAFDFQAQYMEKLNHFFFRPLGSSAYRVSIKEVQMPYGSLSSVPQSINLQFMYHGSVMGDVSSSEGGAPTPDSERKPDTRLY
ncbi:hypothetical protein PsorP6_015204 [Peronosclerospora sorghi]|uniref:Uncharacterized protein n=1 Tax=Peronosclerospora sorghi TaxID=230839 RepID=A0ACC0VS42_9STRA|nr:hypothetical protein PsorP6_015204 [Peronosclerospora sorghi]